MATKLLNRTPQLDCSLLQFGFFDDFYRFTATQFWTRVTTSAGLGVAEIAAVDADGTGGIMQLSTADADDDEEWIFTTNEIFKVKVDKPILAVARLKLTQSGTNTADMFFGLVDAAATVPVDGSSALVAGKHGVAFFKPGGVATLSVASTSTAAGWGNLTVTERSTGTGWETYVIFIESLSATDKRITFHLDESGGQEWRQLKGAATERLIRHNWTLTDTAAGTGELSLMLGVKTTDTAAQLLEIDYAGCWQLR